MKQSLTPEVYTERLTRAFQELRNGAFSVVEVMNKYNLRPDAMRRLSRGAHLLEILIEKGKITVYNYVDPESEEGKIQIQLMAQWLYENPYRRNGTLKVKQITSLTNVAPIDVPNFLTPSATETVMKLATQILLEIQAPLGKSLPANFVREMLSKDQIIITLKQRVAELETELSFWNKQIERAVQKKQNAGSL